MSAITPEYFKYRLEQETKQYKEEIERLNYIINKLDTWLKEKVDSFKEDEYVSTNIEHERLAIKMVYYYLQELKGSDKE